MASASSSGFCYGSPGPLRPRPRPLLSLQHPSRHRPRPPWSLDQAQEREPIVPCIPGTITESSASPGSVLRNGDEYLQFVACSTGAFSAHSVQRGIGLARNVSLSGSWQVDQKPILPLTEQIENSSFYFDPDSKLWYLFTNHVGLIGGAAYTDAIWVYWSTDLTSWNPHDKALVLDASQSKHSHAVIGLPSVLPHSNRLAAQLFRNEQGLPQLRRTFSLMGQRREGKTI